VYVSAANHRYLETKARKGRHTLELPTVLGPPTGAAATVAARVSGRTR
jgi:hypothetical protein